MNNMKTAFKELIEKYSDHLKFDNDLETLNGKDILKIFLVDLVSYQLKEKQQIIDAFNAGYRDSEIDSGITNNHTDIEMFANAQYYFNDNYSPTSK